MLPSRVPTLSLAYFVVAVALPVPSVVLLLAAVLCDFDLVCLVCLVFLAFFVVAFAVLPDFASAAAPVGWEGGVTGIA